MADCVNCGTLNKLAKLEDVQAGYTSKNIVRNNTVWQIQLNKMQLGKIQFTEIQLGKIQSDLEIKFLGVLFKEW